MTNSSDELTIRLLVTGSRDWTDYEKMAEELGLIFDYYSSRHVVLVHGGARGADRMAEEIFRLNDQETEAHPADWDRQQDGSYDKTAGFKRNQEMVESGIDECIAFLVLGSTNRGTLDCVRRAKKLGIPVTEVWSK